MNSLLPDNSRSVSLLILGMLLFLASSTIAQQNILSQAAPVENSSTSYNPSFGRLSLQFGSGVLFGVGGVLLGGLAGVALAPNDKGSGGLIVLGYAAAGSVVGYTAGSAFGVYTVANSQQFNASYGYILLGNVVGAASGIGLSALIDPNDNLGFFSAILVLSSPIVGSMIANKLSIDKRKKKASALLNISDEETTLSTPSLKVTKVGNHNLPEFVNRYAPTVKLLNISL